MFIEAKDDGGGGDNWSYKSCKAPVISSPPTNQHPVVDSDDKINCVVAKSRRVATANSIRVTQISGQGRGCGRLRRIFLLSGLIIVKNLVIVSRAVQAHVVQSVDIAGEFTRSPPKVFCGSVAEWLGCWTCDQQVEGSNPGLSAVECNPGQVVDTHVPLSPSSIIWYQPMGGDALRPLATRHRH